jgi:hypothetical protein
MTEDSVVRSRIHSGRPERVFLPLQGRLSPVPRALRSFCQESVIRRLLKRSRELHDVNLGSRRFDETDGETEADEPKYCANSTSTIRVLAGCSKRPRRVAGGDDNEPVTHFARSFGSRHERRRSAQRRNRHPSPRTHA